jgi:non-specific protein-tyrosine kinase
VETANTESNTLDYLRILWRRKWLIAAATLTAVSISLFISARATPIYSSSSRILFAAQDISLFATQGYVAPDPAQIQTQEQVMTSPAVSTAVAEKLGKDAVAVTDVQAHGIGSTRVLEVTVKATSPTIAAKAATLYATTYQEQRREQAIQESVTLSTKLGQKIAELKQKVQALDAQLATATAKNGSSAEVESIKLQRDAAQANYISYQSKADEASVDASVATGGVEVLVKGQVPTVASSPAPKRSAALAFALGLLLGMAAAIALDFLDDSVKDVDEVERIARPLPILGAIPVVNDWRTRDLPRLVTIEDPSSNISEAYRSLRTSVQFAGLKTDARILQMSSAVAAEGKTTTIANLAVALSLAGLRVTVVDCDLRRPRIHEFFGASNQIGFTSVLLGDQPLSAVLQPITLPSGAVLSLLASGPLPPNPAELLGTVRVGELLATVAAESDIVLLDAPPVLPVTDAIVLSSKVDGVMLVATSQVTGRRHLQQALGAFQAADAPVLGVIVNGASGGSSYEYYSGYKPKSPQNGRSEPSRRRARI